MIESLVALKQSANPFVGLFMLKDPQVRSSFRRILAPAILSGVSQIDLTTDKFQLVSPDQVHSVGTLAHIQQLEATPVGNSAVAMVLGCKICQTCHLSL
jgi:hypothetical protein